MSRNDLIFLAGDGGSGLHLTIRRINNLAGWDLELRHSYNPALFRCRDEALDGAAMELELLAEDCVAMAQTVRELKGLKT
jgi:hypothetical protein